MKARLKQGFTLVEIMIVVVIIGILAALAVPAFRYARIKTGGSAFMNDSRIFANAVQTYTFENGNYPADTSTGAFPPELTNYVAPSRWGVRPGIGGSWDIETGSYGITCAVGVHQFDVSPEEIAKLDKLYDDGNVATGRYRLLAADRYYYIIEP